MPQPFRQANPLDRVVAEQQRMLQVKTLGVRAVQPLVQAGPGQVVGGTGVAQFQDAIGVDQGIDEVVVGQVQLAQVARQPVQQIFFFCAIPAVIAALFIIQVRSPSEASPISCGSGRAREGVVSVDDNVE